MRSFFITVLVLTTYIGYGQETAPSLSEQELIQIVKLYHPVAQQANIGIAIAKTEVTEARGAFDPLLQGNANQKVLGGNLYYNYQQAELRIPTWYGIELNSGIENITGGSTDPQRTLNASSYAGVSFSIGKNMIIDKRRGALQQAKIMVDYSETERLAILNDLLYDALTQYWTWVQAYREWRIINEVVEINKQRVALTKNVVAIGERPAIDSVEAITQLQYYLGLQLDIYNQVQNALLQLSTFTWKADTEPYLLPSNLIPSSNATLEADSIEPFVFNQEELIQMAIQNHPDLALYNLKFKYLDIEKRVKFQELLPELKVKYNQIGKSFNIAENMAQPLLQNNYQYGLSLAMPLRLSQARAGYQQTKLKIQTTGYQQDLKRLSIENKIREYLNTLQNLSQQIQLQKSLFTNLNTLVKGEQTRFEIGESSLFLINSREQKSIETRQKLNATIAKYYKQRASIRWAAGLLSQPDAK